MSALRCLRAALVCRGLSGCEVGDRLLTYMVMRGDPCTGAGPEWSVSTNEAASRRSAIERQHQARLARQYGMRVCTGIRAGAYLAPHLRPYEPCRGAP